MLGYTRWQLLAAIAATLCLVGIIWVAVGILLPPPPTKIAIAGSFNGGHFESLAHRYKDILARSRIKVDVRTTEGSVENLKLLRP
jgi:TRAP-type uncharacterized transport system substrate-binding protein